MRQGSDGNDGRTGDGQSIRTREEFESSLPLFVGGDLDPADERAVEGWLLQHPEDRGLLDAAERARDVLKEHGQRVRAAEVPDLWPGVRRTLGEVGVLAAQPAPRRRSAALSWSRGFAAAAALAVATGIGFVMSDAGSVAGSVAGSDGESVVDPTGFEPIAGAGYGAEAEVELVGSRRQGSPLRRSGPGEEHLIDEAPLVPLWLVVPVGRPD
ncbi:MAG: anti-sigma factor family protein, partial [Planctomycetota bacterium]